jgi:hypothetical protein
MPAEVKFTGATVHKADGTVDEYTAEEWRAKHRGTADLTALLRAHDARVTELLHANNREVERRREAERRVAELEAALLRAQHPMWVLAAQESPLSVALRGGADLQKLVDAVAKDHANRGRINLQKAREFVEDREEWAKEPRW